ncbi:MAG: TetR/AcrR family transcriptional regulator [Proteobacteria bacterium]|nr:MAG: TetR/AcrR family transcriptional regulator [Pseudomonadota bacterium]
MAQSGSDTRQRILKAALTHFAVSGYHGVSVPSIAKDANVSIGSLYNHFESKDALVNTLYFEWKTVLKRYYIEGYPAEASIREQFNFIWFKLHSYADDHPEAFRFIENHMHGHYLQKHCFELEEEIFEIGRMFVRAGQEQGAIASCSPQIVVSIFFGAFVQYFKDCNAGRATWNLETSLFIKEACWKGFSTSP